MIVPVISSRSNARVKQLRAAFQGAARLSGGLVAIEGEHLIQEALRSKVRIETIFLSDRREVPSRISPQTEVLRITDELMRSVAETETPQGIAALVEPPTWTPEDVMDAGGAEDALVLVAANVQDPGNLGTLVRSAEAFGARAVLTTPGTVSPWNQKVLRASVGSVFRMPVMAVSASDLEELQRKGLKLLAAVGSEGRDVEEVQNMDLTLACALMIGNEGNGLAEQWMAMADARVTIPCPGPVESLNAGVAGSLLLYEASRQRAAAGVKG